MGQVTEEQAIKQNQEYINKLLSVVDKLSTAVDLLAVKVNQLEKRTQIKNDFKRIKK